LEWLASDIIRNNMLNKFLPVFLFKNAIMQTYQELPVISSTADGINGASIYLLGFTNGNNFILYEGDQLMA
jgi:hypothetical protein